MWLIYKTQRKNTKVKKKTRDSRYNAQYELDRACFQHNMFYEDFQIYIEELLLRKCCRTKYLILLKTK